MEYGRTRVAAVAAYFSRRAFVLSQIDVEDVDPALIAWIFSITREAKHWVAVSIAIEQEQRKMGQIPGRGGGCCLGISVEMVFTKP